MGPWSNNDLLANLRLLSSIRDLVDTWCAIEMSYLSGQCWRERLAMSLLFCSFAMFGCGGSTPTSPSSGGSLSSPGALVPATVRASLTRNGVVNVLRLSWTGSSAATSYFVEIGTASMHSDVLQREVAGSVLEFETEVPAGRLFARVKALRGTETSQASSEVEVNAPDFKNVIEALFLGTGPLSRTESTGCNNSLQRLRGWPSVGPVRVVTYASLDANGRDAVQQAIQRANETFGVTLAHESRITMDDGGVARTGEIGVFTSEADQFPALCQSTSGCHLATAPLGIYSASRIILPRPLPAHYMGLIAHEFGHAFGLCHIDPTRAGLDPAMSIMGQSLFVATRWTAIDLEAFDIVYGSGLRPGDTRQRFLNAGLIHQ